MSRYTSGKFQKLRFILLIFCGLSAFPLAAQGQGSIIVPRAGADLSAHRIDSDIFGWNEDYSEMAAIGLDIKRGPKGKHRGEVFMLIFPIDSIVPTQNVKLHHVTQADMPHNPLPILDVRKYMWTLGYGLPKMWPKHVKKSKPRGGMDVTPIWLPEQQSNGQCRPNLGFILSTAKEVRYLPHQLLNIEVICQHLRLSDYRTYYAHKYLAGSMVRFDYSGTDNEASVRFPINVQWKKAKSINIEVEMPSTASKKNEALIRKKLKGIKHIKFRYPKTQQTRTQIIYNPHFTTLATQIALKLDGQPTPTNRPAASSITIKLGQKVFE